MTYENFIEFLEKELKIYPQEERKEDYYSAYYRERVIDKIRRRLVLEEKWLSGGQTGGNCWGDVADHGVNAEAEPELTDLDDVLAKFAPDISYIGYKRLSNKLINTGSFTQNEYYGNYYEYSTKFVYLDELYEYLKTELNIWKM